MYIFIHTCIYIINISPALQGFALLLTNLPICMVQIDITSLWNLHMITKAILLALWTHNSNKMSNSLPPCGHSACCTSFLCWNAKFIQNFHQCNNSIIMIKIITNIYASSNNNVAGACIKFCGGMFLVIGVTRKRIFPKFETVSVRQVLSCFKLPSHSH